jgi:hypothetical protein
MPYVGILQAAGLAKETVLGTAVTTPTEFLPLIAPDSFTEEITLLESKGIRAQPDSVIKVYQGPASLKSGKIKMECEPENCGNQFMAAFGLDTLTGTGLLGYTHTFTRASTATLPTYTWWFHKGAKYFLFPGSMLNKLTLDVKAGEFVTLDTDWTALKYDDTGITHSPTYSPLKPFVFQQAVVKIDGSQINDYDNVQVVVDNMVQADHALSSSIYPAKIYSKGMRVTVTMDLFLENTTQWAKFLSGTSASVNLALTSAEIIPGTSPSVPYSLTLDIPNVNYTAAPLVIQPGVLKINFAGVAWYDTVSTKTMSAALVNSVSAAY